jgi:hypothetical protein
MAAGFRSPLPILGLSQGPVGAGFTSPLFPLGLSSVAGVSTDGGATSFFGWWLGGFSGYAAATNSPWYFLKSNRKRRSD